SPTDEEFRPVKLSVRDWLKEVTGAIQTQGLGRGVPLPPDLWKWVAEVAVAIVNVVRCAPCVPRDWPPDWLPANIPDANGIVWVGQDPSPDDARAYLADRLQAQRKKLVTLQELM